MRALVRRRVRAARQLFFLAAHAGVGSVSLTIFVHFVAGLTPPLVILGSGIVVSAVTGENGSFIFGAVLCAIGLVVQQVMAPLQVALTSRVSLRVDAYCSMRLMKSISAASSLRAVEDPKVIVHVSEASDALDARYTTPGAATAGALALIARYTQLVAAAVLLAVNVSIPVGLVALGIGLLNRASQTIGFSTWVATSHRFAARRRRVAYLRELATSPTAARDIRMLRLTGWIEARYRTEALHYLRPMWRAKRAIFEPMFLFSGITSIVGASVLFALAVTALTGQGAVQPGTIAIVLQCAIVCVLFGVVFPDIDPQMQFGRVAWEAIVSAEAALQTVGGSASEVSEPHSVSPDRSGPAEIVLSDVVYRYAPDEPVLEGVSLHLEAGRSTALVGINGAGKSTLVKVLAGFYTPLSGSVMLDGEELDTAAGQLWQQRIAIVFQDYLRYQLTLRQNLQMQALDGADDDDGMIACLREVGLGVAFSELDRGLDTSLSRLLPGGTDLSGGQWQRVALARALYAVRHGARALVLDEPTSQLDARGEAEFFSNFIDLTKGVTTLVISHRFSSVRKADKICVLSEGTIIETGSHAQLIGADGEYARMFTAQSSRYSAVDPN